MFIVPRYALRIHRKIVVPGCAPVEVPDELGKKMIASGIAAPAEKQKNKSGK
jgi:hypothetical protein